VRRRSRRKAHGSEPHREHGARLAEDLLFAGWRRRRKHDKWTAPVRSGETTPLRRGLSSGGRLGRGQAGLPTERRSVPAVVADRPHDGARHHLLGIEPDQHEATPFVLPPARPGRPASYVASPHLARGTRTPAPGRGRTMTSPTGLACPLTCKPQSVLSWLNSHRRQKRHAGGSPGRQSVH